MRGQNRGSTDCFSWSPPREVRRAMSLVFLPLVALNCVFAQNQVMVTSGNYQPPVIGHITIMARGFEPTKSDREGPAPHNLFLTGHIFIRVTQNTDRGPASDTFGFYPEDGKTFHFTSSVPNGMGGFILGPGRLRSEDRCNSCTPASIAKHYGAVRESVDIDLTFLQKEALFKKIDEWNAHEYQLLGNNSNCIDFVDSAVRSLGYPVPERYPLQSPLAYMTALKKTVDAEKLSRAEKLQLQAEKARQEAEEAQRQRTETARQVADVLQRGWGKCSCPVPHAAYGVLIDGNRYHAKNITCPRR